MKAMLMSAPGDPDVFELGEVPTPTPGQSELLVRLRAAGINPLDTKVRKMHMFFPNNLPAILGCDGAGIVEAVGPGVTRFAKGDEVYFFNNGLGAEPGSCAEYEVVHEDFAARKPHSLTMTEAAAVPLVLITAWEALQRAGLRSGETILIHAGAGGVGHVAVQLASNLGARVAATVSGSEKAELVKTLGAEVAIDYKTTDFVQQTLEWTGGKGADVVLDTVGGATFAKSFGAVRLYGRLATLLSTTCEMPDVNKARMRNITVVYVQMTTPLLLGEREFRRAQTAILEEGARLFDQGRLKVSVSEVLRLEDLAAAHRLVEGGHTTGKVVVEIA
ncbi:MAG: zinc-dependent alcohol dehydrogenase family protein [Lautropia sp.]